MNASDALERKEGNVDNVAKKIDLMMPADTNEVKETNNNDNESCVDGNDNTKKGSEIMHNVDMEENVGQAGEYIVAKEDNPEILSDQNYVDNNSCVNKISN
jgi:hypothetical protein